MLQSLDMESNAADSLMWASNDLTTKAITQPQDCWDLIVQISKETNDDWVLTNLASGPLETLLASHPHTVIEQLEAAARDDRKIRFLVTNLWQNLIPDDVWARLQKLK